MFQAWRLKLREAEEALAQGRLDDAGRLLLEQEDLRQYLPGQRIAARVASSMAERALKSAVHGDSSAAWEQWAAARRLSGDTEELLSARQALLDLAVADAETHLRNDDVAGVLDVVSRLERHKIASDTLRTLKEVGMRLESARKLIQRGHFTEAEAQLAAAASLRPDIESIGRRRSTCQEQMQFSREWTEQLHRALTSEQWSEALSLADRILEIAPEHRVARDARRRAWAAAGTRLTDSHPLALTQMWRPSRREASAGANGKRSHDFEPSRCGPRFFLWIDAVGGYLVCLAPEIYLGQAVPGNYIDVPILADLSRRHVKLVRQGEGYLLEALHEVRVRGRSVTDKCLLADGDEIELGSGVRLRFRQPHVLSASARLEFLSRHRTQPSADAVLLMGESCVLGPQRHNHIVCRDWSSDVVLFRQDGDLYCRATGELEIDGQFCDGRGRVHFNSHITGGDFSMSLEELDKCKNQPLL